MIKNRFDIPIDDRYFEDYVPGSIYEFGTIRVEEQEILDFAGRFDPQPLHTDREAAKNNVFGGLIASGWHTAALMMRLFVDYYLSHAASLSSPGVDELRWLRPVRPGDELSIRLTVLETKRSHSKPDRGIVHTFIEAMNQDREIVMSMKALNFLACRDGKDSRSNG